MAKNARYKVIAWHGDQLAKTVGVGTVLVDAYEGEFRTWHILQGRREMVIEGKFLGYRTARSSSACKQRRSQNRNTTTAHGRARTVETKRMEKSTHTPARCSKCDDARRREGTPQLVGKPCDICDGRGFDYLGRECRHALSCDGEVQ